MFVKKSQTYVQNVNLSETYRNNYSLPLYILQNLQKYCSLTKCNFTMSTNSLPTKKALKLTSNTCRQLNAGANGKKPVAIVKYKKQPDSLKMWKFGGVVTYLKSHPLRTTLHELTVKPINVSYDSLKAFYMAFKRDAILTQRYLKSRLINRILAVNDMSLGECFNAVAESHANDVMIYFENTRWTYKQVEILSNKITNYFLSLSYEKGDVVAILATNRPEYLIMVIGLSKIGVISALIDVHFKDDSLVHSIELSDCKGLIVSDDLLSEFNKVKNKISATIELFQLDGLLQSTNFKNLADALIVSPDKAPEIIYKVNQNDPLVYIYTRNASCSPQAAMLTHSKFIENSIRITYLLNLTINDIIYDPLPLYCTTGLAGGTGPSIIFGVPVVLRRKFSAAKYWSDCRKYKCTVGQYVGDICKNLLLQPESSDDKKHNLKKMLGSGLGKEVWKEFVQRFDVEVAELYGSSDTSRALIKNTGEASNNDIGPLLPRYLQPHPIDSQMLRPFEPTGKLLSLEKGEELTLKVPAASPHCFYYKVTTKGQDDQIDFTINVATSSSNDETTTTGKIESVINHLAHPSQCTVYSVPIPNTNGKVRMAMIVDPQNKIDRDTFMKEMTQYLPDSACPVLMRLSHDPSRLLTVHDRRHAYVKEGFDPTKIRDKLYYIDKTTQTFTLLTEDAYQKIIASQILI